MKKYMKVTSRYHCGKKQKVNKQLSEVNNIKLKWYLVKNKNVIHEKYGGIGESTAWLTM